MWGHLHAMVTHFRSWLNSLGVGPPSTTWVLRTESRGQAWWQVPFLLSGASSLVRSRLAHVCSCVREVTQSLLPVNLLILRWFSCIPSMSLNSWSSWLWLQITNHTRILCHRAVVVHAFHPSTWGIETDGFLTPKPARATQWEFVSTMETNTKNTYTQKAKPTYQRKHKWAQW